MREAVFSIMLFGASADLLVRWGQVIEEAPRELTSFLSIFRKARGAPIVQLYNVYADDDTRAAGQALSPLFSIGTLLDELVWSCSDRNFAHGAAPVRRRRGE